MTDSASTCAAQPTDCAGASDDVPFFKDLIESDTAVWMVTQALRKAGYGIFLPKLHFDNVSDDGDLFVLLEPVDDDIKKQSLEVKWLKSADFDSFETFPYVMAMVAEKHRADTWEREPKYTLLVASSLSGAMVVPITSRDKWVERTVWDRRKHRRSTFYLVSLDECSYWNLKESPTWFVT